MTIGRHVDVSDLTEEECNKIISVISKDIIIRKSEKERRAYLNKKFEDLRREILLANSKRKKRYTFDDYCLICGKHLFTFCCFLNRGEECVSCEHFCCTSCSTALVIVDKNDTDKYYLCSLCIHKRRLKCKTNEWFYEIFQRRFKRFGSAKALRAIYKQRKSIEPRVITLLALCRELQPARVLSIPFQRKIDLPSSQDDSGVYYSANTSTYRKGSYETIILDSSRKRYLSESEVEQIEKTDINLEINIDTKDHIETHPQTPELETVVELVNEISINESSNITCEPKTENNFEENLENLGEYIEPIEEHNFEADIYPTEEDIEPFEDKNLVESSIVIEHDEVSESVPLLSFTVNEDEDLDKEISFSEAKETNT